LIKILIFFFIITTLHASDTNLESKIFKNIIHAIVQKEHPTIYIHKKLNSLSNHPGGLNISSKCEDADLVILSTLKGLPQKCQGKLLFGSRYSHLKNSNVIGSFFWQKGRPNILFYKDRLKKNQIKLDNSFDKYIEK